MAEAAKLRLWRAESAFAFYAISVFTVLIAAGLRLFLNPVIGGRAPFAVFLLAILMSAFIGGRGPGLMATALSAPLGDYLFAGPRAFGRPDVADFLNIGVVAAVGIAISAICGQLKAALARSNEERERLRLVSDTVPQFLWTMQPNGAPDFMNARWYEYTGADPASDSGSGWAAYVHPDDLPSLERLQAERDARGNHCGCSLRLRRRDGVYRWFDFRLVPLRGESGKVLKWFGSGADIQESREQQARFDQIVTSSPGLIYRFLLRSDGSTAMPFANSALRDLWGLDPAQVQNDASPIFARIHEEDRDRVMAGIQESARTMSVLEERFRVRHPEKGELRIAARCSPVREADLAVSWYGFAWDETESYRSQEVRRAKSASELALLRTLVEGAPIGIVMLDRAMRFVEASRRALEDARIAREEVIGKTHYECFPDFPEHLRKKLQRALAGERISGREERLYTPDGREHWLNWQVVPWGDAGETTGGIVIYAEDITERKIAEASNRRLELSHSALFENMTEGLAYCRMLGESGKFPDFLYLSVNSAFSRLSGVLSGVEDVTGSRMSELQPKMLCIEPPHVEMFARVASTGRPEKCETWNRRLGEWFSFSAYSPERGYFVLVFDRITLRKKAEQAARQWQRAFEQSESAIALTDVATATFQSVNGAFARKLGYTPAELAGKPVADLFPPDGPGWSPAPPRDGEPDPGHWVYEARHVRKDRSVIPVLIDSTLIRDDEGKPVSRVTFLQDLTEERKAEAELRDHEETVRALLDSAGEAIIAVDREGRIVLANRRAGEMFGYGNELTGRPLSDLLPREVCALHGEYEREFFSQPKVRRLGTALDLCGIRRGGQSFPVDISLSFVETRQGPMAVAFIIDVSELRESKREILRLNAGLEQRVRERTEQLEAANRDLESFSYSVSHDLRAPLRGIDNWSLALLEDYGALLDGRARHYLDRVREEARRMGMLIDDLLELSKVSRSELRPGPVDLSSIAQQVAADLRAANPDRRLVFTIEPGLRTQGDPNLLKVALTNLLENAVKFTGPKPEALIEFGSVPRAGAGDLQKRAFAIRDNGVGFEARYAGMLFGPFQRLHNASEFPGTGIGLATVQRVIRRHGGEVWAEAEPDRGATFGFTISERQPGQVL